MVAIKMGSTFSDRIETLIRDSGGQSALARRSGLSLGAIQRYLKGGEPTRGALIRLSEACEVSLSWLVFGNDDEKTELQARHEIPVYGFAECGLQGWYNEVRYRIVTALDWPDPEMFAVIASGHSMAPEGIHPGFFCMVSPNTKPQRGDAILIRKRDRTSTIKVYHREDKDWLYVGGWLDPETPGGAQLPYTDQIRRDAVERLAPVIMVKRRV
jgi:phage repressor protein C with HTH and peptisase S24 domain